MWKYLLGASEHKWIMTFHSVGNVIIPTDFYSYFQRGRYTTNQMMIRTYMWLLDMIANDIFFCWELGEFGFYEPKLINIIWINVAKTIIHHPIFYGLYHPSKWWWLGDGLWHCFNHMITIYGTPTCFMVYYHNCENWDSTTVTKPNQYHMDYHNPWEILILQPR